MHRARPSGLPPDEAFALIETQGGVRRIAATDAAALAAGVRLGQKLAEAQSICPALQLADADPQGDAAALARLATWCERYTPMTAPDGPDGLWLDITGCAHLFGDEAALAKDLLATLQARGLHGHVGIASTAGAAWAFARWFPANGQRLVAPPPAEEKPALAQLPAACLRLDDRSIAGLRRLGLRRVEDLLRIPRAELAAGFGRIVLPRLDQALGQIDEAILWQHPPPPWAERQAFAEPIATPEDLQRTLADLTGLLCHRLEATRQGALRLTARFFRVDGVEQSLAIALARPVRDPIYLTRLLSARLEQIDPGFGIEIAALEAGEIAPLTAPQSSFDEQPPSSLPELVDALSNRLGAHHVWRAGPRASHVPEHATRCLPPLDANIAWAPEPDTIRPLRLLRRPEPIEALAALPDEPPRLFRWRRCLHHVRGATGPERIAREWWSSAPPDPQNQRPEHDHLRDYYCVEDAQGARFWIFRVGLAGQPAWFLHGLFG